MANEYPKAKYSKTENVAVVKDVVEEKALVGEWFDFPDFTNRPKKEVVEEKPAKAEKQKTETAK